MEDIKQNERLIARYPFLAIDKDATTTWLDSMPIGWRLCFGNLMCEDILNALIEAKINPNTYKIIEIKEKYGSLRWYDNPSYDCIDEIISDYEHLSAHVCIDCGQIGAPIYDGWISPYCDECASKHYQKPIKSHQLKEGIIPSCYSVVEYDGKTGVFIKKPHDVSYIVNRIDKKYKKYYKGEVLECNSY